MAKNTLTAQRDGTAIYAEAFNAIKRALCDTVYPRNGSARAEHVAGSLGSLSLDWLALYAQTVALHHASSLHSVELAAPTSPIGSFDLTLPSTLPGLKRPWLVTTAGVMVNFLQMGTSQFKDGGVSGRSILNNSTSDVSTAILNAVNTSTTYQTIAGLEVTISRKAGAGTQLIFVALTGISGSTAYMGSTDSNGLTTTRSCAIDVKIQYEDSNAVGTWIDLVTAPFSNSLTNAIEMPFPTVKHFDRKTALDVQRKYRVQYKTRAGSTDASMIALRLFATTLG
jgi:hypothetical protein